MTAKTKHDGKNGVNVTTRDANLARRERILPMIPVLPGERARLARCLAILIAASALTAVAQSARAADDATTAHTASAGRPALSPDPAFAAYPRYTGAIGATPIELRLGENHSDEGAGLHGEYRDLVSGRITLVAGDRSGDVMQLEESDDGTRISGLWVVHVAADGSLSGTRVDAKGTREDALTVQLVAQEKPLTGPATPQ
jgi:hypothetical protein